LERITFSVRQAAFGLAKDDELKFVDGPEFEEGPESGDPVLPPSLLGLFERRAATESCVATAKTMVTALIKLLIAESRCEGIEEN
jgi:hypothetical protein